MLSRVGAAKPKEAICVGIHLLSKLELRRGSEMIAADAWPSRKACQLFRILVTWGEQTVGNDELVEWL